MEERRNTAKGEKHQLKELSKRIKNRQAKNTADSRRNQRHQKSISCIKSARKRTFIPKVKNDTGESIISRKGTANVFGEFCSKLYAETQIGKEVEESQNTGTRMNNEKKSCSEDVQNEIPEFTQKEIQAAIDSLKKR